MTKLRCTNGKPTQFGIDPLNKQRLSYAHACIKHLTGLEVSSSGIIRDALTAYVRQLDSILTAHPEKIESLIYSLKKAHKGSTANLNSLNSTDGCVFPTFDGLQQRQRFEERMALRESLKIPLYANNRK